ncbi:MAG TPA: kynureninase [Steroidobacteraceae bacterium]|nr:kynureninase [Steroidobacteraceae bacterium]
MSTLPSLAEARARDERDALRPFRSRFALPSGPRGEPLTYLCGHSLGLMPLAARELVGEELDDWARLAVEGHERARRPWIPYHENLTAGLAALTGARAGEVIAMNSLTVNLHLMLASFYRPQGERTRILIEAGAFPSDRHAVTSQLAWWGLESDSELVELAPRPGEDTLDPEALEQYLEEHGERVALILWPSVQYRTGQAFDAARLVHAAHRHGCVAGLDLAHGIGNLPLALHDSDADFAVWCSYKYLNAGPGAIGGCFVHERHTHSLAPTRHRGALPGARLAGWWGHEEPTRFRMEPQFRAATGVAAWQLSNPPILAAAPLLASLNIFTDATIGALREKSRTLTAFLEAALAPLAPRVQVITPADPEQRGCQLSLRIGTDPAHARRVFETLNERGAICDWRSPDIIRVAPVPLYNRFEDAWRFAQLLGDVLHP